MNQSTRTLTRAIAVCVCIFSLTGGLRAQNTNSTGTIMWPNNPPVGIGTQLDGGPLNALHIHHDAAHSATLPAILRLSDGSVDSTNIFATLALMPGTVGFPLTTYSYLAVPNDVVLHENIGDLILADLDPQPAAIRMSTTPDPTTLPPAGPPPYTDLERETILSNGNIGIDLPPGIGGLCAPLDQVQLGGGVLYSGNPAAGPGLTIFGGYRFENMLRPVGMGGGLFPADWRYIAYNEWVDHTDSSSNRFKRFQPMSSSRFAFASSNGGLLDLNCYPYDSARGINDFSKGTTMELTGSGGLSLWFMDTTANPYHHLLDVYLPGQLPYGVTRNVSGLSYFHTPLCIGIDTPGHPLPNFTNLTNVHPGIGDGQTWMLAVNGAALFKEAWVNTADWPDYVFLPDYQLMTVENFGNFIKTNHHLPDLPDAKTMENGVPLGKTEAAMTKQMEEMALYIVQLNKAVEALKAEVEQLKIRKEGKP